MPSKSTKDDEDPVLLANSVSEAIFQGPDGAPQLSRRFVARRISEGETGRLKEELKCQACGKGYKHVSSLAKHLWEHTPEWNVTSKLLISKHQQVQLLEAASILVSMNEQVSDTEGSSERSRENSRENSCENEQSPVSDSSESSKANSEALELEQSKPAESGQAPKYSECLGPASSRPIHKPRRRRVSSSASAASPSLHVPFASIPDTYIKEEHLPPSSISRVRPRKQSAAAELAEQSGGIFETLEV